MKIQQEIFDYIDFSFSPSFFSTLHLRVAWALLGCTDRWHGSLIKSDHMTNVFVNFRYMATRRHTYIHKYIHTYIHTNAVTLVWSSLRLAPINRATKRDWKRAKKFTGKKFTGKRGQNADDVTPSPCFGQKAGPTDRRLSPARVIH